MSLAVPRRAAATTVALLLLALPLAACGQDAETTDRVEADTDLVDLANGKSTEIQLAPEFTEALDTLQLETDVQGDASLIGGDTLSFPITGGNISLFEPGSVPDYVVGQVQHVASGFSLTDGETEVVLGNFNIDPRVSRVYGSVVVDGETEAFSTYLFRLDGSTLEERQMDGTDLILTGTGVYVSDVAAGLLNDTFGTDALTDQQLVGTATITIDTAA